MQLGPNKIIVNKIKKLLALSTSSNEHEAALASQRANELLIKHNLSLTEIQGADDIVEFETTPVSRIPSWKEILFSNIADYYFCRLFRTTEKNNKHAFLLIGKQTNIEIAKQMFEYLAATIDKMAKKQTYFKGRTSLNSYRHGIVSTLIRRFEEMKKQAMEKGIKSQTLTCNALVVQDLYAQNESLINQYISEWDIGNPNGCSIRFNPLAFNLGRNKGHEISLNEQVKSGQTYSIS
jgi:hypothetical protein